MASLFHEQVDVLASEFWEAITSFLNALPNFTDGHENLRFLASKLDSNSFYGLERSV